jgi:hypothetical protein
MQIIGDTYISLKEYSLLEKWKKPWQRLISLKEYTKI